MQIIEEEQVIPKISKVAIINRAGLGLLMRAHQSLGEGKIRLFREMTEVYGLKDPTIPNIEKIIALSSPEAQPSSSGSHRLSTTSGGPDMTTPPVFDFVEMEDLFFPIFERLEKKDFNLPPLPQIANQVLALTTDPEVNASQLKTANSAGCGAVRQIESVEQAIAWLGLNNVAGTAFALSFQSSVFNDRGYEAEVRGLRAHAIATGFYAKAVAGIIGRNQDAAFLCGLLHSIGKPFVVHTVNGYHPASASPLPWVTILSLMDQSYVEIGRQIADEWNFPSSVKEAINLHQPHSYHLTTSPTKGASITCLARELASVHLNSPPISTERLRTLPVVRALNISGDVMDGMSEIKQNIQVQIDSLSSSRRNTFIHKLPDCLATCVVSRVVPEGRVVCGNRPGEFLGEPFLIESGSFSTAKKKSSNS